jgi:hypothetical protein
MHASGKTVLHALGRQQLFCSTPHAKRRVELQQLPRRQRWRSLWCRGCFPWYGPLAAPLHLHCQPP